MARGSVVKRPSGYYAMVYRVDNKQVWKNISKNKKDAEKSLNQVISELDNGVYRKPTEIGFSKFAEKWLSYKEPQLKPTTIKSYSEMVNQHIAPYFKERKLHRITQHDIDEYVAFKTKEGKLKNRTIGYHVTILKMMLKRAVIWEYIRVNPAQYTEKPKAERTEIEPLSSPEIQLFMENVNPMFYPFFLTAVLTGMRRGEILALRWSDINWATGYIRVRRSLSLGIVQEPKSKHSIRSIVMAPKLIQVLRKHQLACKPSELDLVFPNRVGGLMDGRNMYQREFLAALRRAGLRKVRFHDLRHSYASILISQGENIKFIQNQLGHGSAQVTLDTYGHLMPQTNNGAAEKLEQSIFGDQGTAARSNSILGTV